MRLFALVLVLLFASPSFASYLLVAKFENRGSNGVGYSGGKPSWGTGSGGEFTVQLGRFNNDPSNLGVTWLNSSNAGVIGSTYFDSKGFYNYNTFCVEAQESLSNGTTYFIGGNSFFTGTDFNGLGSLTQGAFQGGAGAVNFIDTLDNRSANIYQDWVASNSKSDSYANNVQDAIWKLEQEKTTVGSGAQSLINGASNAANGKVGIMNTFVYNAGTSVSASNYRNLVYNFSTSATSWDNLLKTNARQSQIVLTGSLGTTPTVPEPATAGLLGLGMLVAGAYRARRKSKVNA